MSRKTSPYPLISVEEAVSIVLSFSAPLGIEEVALKDADGLVLACDVFADAPLPPFPASVKDGYAVIAADGPGVYPVLETITAGMVPKTKVTPKTVSRITTGSAMPEGADAVVMVEYTLLLNDKTADGKELVKIEPRVQASQDVRPIGADIVKDALVLSKGTLLRPAEIGILATVGCGRVKVYRRPKVAVLSTGDELIEPNQPLVPGKIRDSNRATLIAALKEIGSVDVIDLGIAGDTRPALEAKMTVGLDQADVVLTSGGVSMGDLDLIQPILEERGKVHFGRVLMKPGKPLTFATLTHRDQRKLVFGLPGNPVSSIVTYYLSVVPCVRSLLGYTNPHLAKFQVKTTKAMKLDPERPEYHRAVVSWSESAQGLVAESTGAQASSRLLSMCSANALLVLPQQSGQLPSNSVVTALMIGRLSLL